ncbi:hypothetical protein PybrP1_011129, partial [[Pythium] brassicae (nom. inval.)]
MYLEALAHDLERTQRAIPSSCLFCAPQPRSLLADQAPSLDELYAHFLTPAGAADDAHTRRAGEYETLNGKSVTIQGSHVVTGRGFPEPRKVRILLSEPREVHRQRVTVLHLSRPLVGGVALPEDPNEIDVATFRRVTAILRAFPENELAFFDLDATVAQVRKICAQHQFFNRYEATLPALLRDEWDAAVDAILRAGSFDSDGDNDGDHDDSGYGAHGASAGRSHHMLQIQQVVECYLTEQLHAVLFPRVVVGCRAQDAALARVLYRMRHYSPADFGVRTAFQCSVQPAVDALLGVRGRKTPLDMLLAFKSCIDRVNDAITRNLEQHRLDFGRYQMTTDDILDQLLYVLVQAHNQAALADALPLHLRAGSDSDESADRVDGGGAGRGSLSQSDDTHGGDAESQSSQLHDEAGWSQEDATSFPVAAVLKYISEYHFINSNTTALGFTIANFQVATEYFLLRASHLESGDAAAEAPCSQGIPLSKCELAHARIQRDLERHAAERQRQRTAQGTDQRVVPGVNGGTTSSECVGDNDDDDDLRRLFIVGEWSASDAADDGEQEEIEAERAGARVTRVHSGSVATSAPPSKIVGMSAGQRFFAAVSDQGQLFTWGDRSGGRLGYPAAAGDARRVPAPRVVAALCTQQVVAVACGAFHTLATDVNGHVFAWGSNTRGQLGFLLPHSSADSTTVVAPTLVTDLRGTYVGSVACGEYHSLALSSAGRVFSWGCNRYSKLGRPAETFADAVQPKALEERWLGLALDLRTPLLVPGDAGDASLHSVVRRIAAGKDHSLAITYAGAVFTWGRGDSGQLGHGNYMDVARPAQVMALSYEGDGSGRDAGVCVVDADGGSDFSLFLGSAGVAFVCGRDPSSGLRVTGSTTRDDEDAAAMTLFPQVIALSGSAGDSSGASDPTATVLGVSCGESHFALHLSD